MIQVLWKFVVKAADTGRFDAWDSRELRDAMLAGARAEYAALDAGFDGWTESESELGIFDVVQG